jgi:hypothetical protein
MCVLMWAPAPGTHTQSQAMHLHCSAVAMHILCGMDAHAVPIRRHNLLTLDWRLSTVHHALPILLCLGPVLASHSHTILSYPILSYPALLPARS